METWGYYKQMGFDPRTPLLETEQEIDRRMDAPSSAFDKMRWALVQEW